jgi:polyisoprenyl-phosphate glycosyltransferase
MNAAEPLPPEPTPDLPLVTVVLPCFNEGAHVLAELDRISAALDASPYSYEILAIDDASTDDTLAVLRQAAARMPTLRVLAFRRNGGSGTARRIGSQQARGEIVVWTDADMSYPNERIPDLVAVLVEDGSYDQVVGARTTEEGTFKVLRVPAKWFIRKVAERLSNQKIPDLNSGLRAFRREVALPYLPLLPAGFSCVTTITLAFFSNQHDIRYIPIDYAKRAGTSKFHFTRDAYRYILQVLRMVMYFDPLKVLMPPALWLLALGAVKAVVDMVRHPFYFPASTVLLVITGLLIGSMALLADLIVRSRGSSMPDPGVRVVSGGRGGPPSITPGR